MTVTPSPVVTPPIGRLERARIAFVTTLYHELLGRDPEPQGLKYWVQRLAAGVPFVRIALAFWLSPEHRDLEREHRDTGVNLRTAFDDSVRVWRESLVKESVHPVGPRSLMRTQRHR